jgi:hypothetical protein
MLDARLSTGSDALNEEVLDLDTSAVATGIFARPRPGGWLNPPRPRNLTGMRLDSPLFSLSFVKRSSSSSSSCTSSMPSPTVLAVESPLRLVLPSPIELKALLRRRWGGRSMLLRRSIPSLTTKKS